MEGKISESTLAMYPRVRVKVRGGGEGEEHEEGPLTLQKEKNSLLLRIFESISLQNCGSPGNENCDVSPPHARIPKSYVPNVPVPSVAVSKDNTHRSAGKNNKETDEESRTHIRASSVPRPRAVLSSPNNDGMIGSRNRISREGNPISKTHNPRQDTLGQGKRVLKNVNIDSPVNTRRILKEADSKIHPKEKHVTELAATRQKSSLGKGKTRTVGL